MNLAYFLDWLTSLLLQKKNSAEYSVNVQSQIGKETLI